MNITKMVGRTYRHYKKQSDYLVTGFANLQSNNHAKFPPLIIYQSMTVPPITWARPVSEFVTRFEDVSSEEEILLSEANYIKNLYGDVTEASQFADNVINYIKESK